MVRLVTSCLLCSANNHRFVYIDGATAIRVIFLVSLFVLFYVLLEVWTLCTLLLLVTHQSTTIILNDISTFIVDHNFPTQQSIDRQRLNRLLTSLLMTVFGSVLFWQGYQAGHTWANECPVGMSDHF